MPSSYTPILRLEKQVKGEQTDAWGGNVNTVFDLLDDSIAGVAPLSVAGSGDYTLSTANSADDEARQAILKCTGTLTGTRTIITPSVPKVYVVWNATAGSFDLKISISGGTALLIPPNSVSTVVTDGTNFYYSGLPGALSNAFTIPGSIALDDNATVTGAAPFVKIKNDSGDPQNYSLAVDSAAKGMEIKQAATVRLSVRNAYLYAGTVAAGSKYNHDGMWGVTANSVQMPPEGTPRTMQWGRASVGGGQEVEVTFPRAFNTTSTTPWRHIVVTVSVQGAQTSGFRDAISAMVTSNTKMTIYNPNGITYLVGWQAMGR